ncbi:Ribonuclease 3 [bioreactor metagenome]|uniref:Ribonuclease 3 n=1 Tax=bioreactor metagenome TaxID=1076179 RepID=A0A644VQU6_9ZZZZ|nr:putative dsRNA-binding protein [Desulfitobacterium hafniense]MEA5021865.1 putative dsRNA-binding protein [Desulfitobacterium hafniense]
MTGQKMDEVINCDFTRSTKAISLLLNMLGLDVEPEKLGFSLCHRSFLFESNEKAKIESLRVMEILGASLLNLIACTKRFTDRKIPNKQLSTVFEKDKYDINLSFYKYYKVYDYVQFGKSERMNSINREFYQDVSSQFLFALFEQTNFNYIYNILEKFFTTEQMLKDPKTYLLEYTQRQKQRPLYKTVREFGPDHVKQFEVELTALGKSVRARGKSKKLAEIEAAKIYIANNNLNINDNIKVESSPIRLGQKWQISTSRKKELNVILNQLGLDENELPFYMLDQ